MLLLCSYIVFVKHIFIPRSGYSDLGRTLSLPIESYTDVECELALDPINVVNVTVCDRGGQFISPSGLQPSGDMNTSIESCNTERSKDMYIYT